jgi:hypothetical protein
MKEIEQEFWELVDKDYGLNREGADRDVIIKHRKIIDELYRRLAFQPGQNKSYFWVHCSAQTFKTHYKPRLQKYLFNHVDHTEIDFLKNEYLTISKFAHTHKDPTLLSLETQQVDSRFYYEKRDFLLNKLSTFNLNPVKIDEIDSDEAGRKEVLTYTDWQAINVPKEEIKNGEIFIPTVDQKECEFNTIESVFFLEKIGLTSKMEKAGFTNEDINKTIAKLIRRHYKTVEAKRKDLTLKKYNAKQKSALEELDKKISSFFNL